MPLYLLSLLAGFITILAPCTFLLLPVIVGGSLGTKNRWRPYIITGSLGLSLFVFTLLLKATSLFINLDQNFLNYLSGGLISIIGLITLFPSLWDNLSIKLGLSKKSDELLEKAGEKEGFWGSVLTGVAMGPVFSSCSPTYVIALGIVLRGDLTTGIISMLAYIFGLSVALLLVALVGKKMTSRLKWAVNPSGIFKKVISIIFIIVGLLIATGADKSLQVYLANNTPFSYTAIEANLLNINTGTTQTKKGEKLPIIKKAPELQNLANWINSNPLKIEELKGKVVLVDFWTYSCVNCIRTQPFLNDWHQKYAKDGLVILGIHAPEFAFEKNLKNVEEAVKKADIKYPVALDNDFSTWDAYDNEFWPAKYLIDAEGNIRYFHFGEGKYTETEENIVALLAEAGKTTSASLGTKNNNIAIINDNSQFDQSPETYINWSRAKNWTNRDPTLFNKTGDYTLNPNLTSNQWSLGGTWEVGNDGSVSKPNSQKSNQKTNQLNLNFSAKEVFLVLANNEQPNFKVKVELNGKTIEAGQKGEDVSLDGLVQVAGNRLYKLVNLPKFESNQNLTLTVDEGVEVFAFTFGK